MEKVKLIAILTNHARRVFPLIYLSIFFFFFFAHFFTFLVTLEDVDLDGDASCKYCVDSTYEGTVEPTSLYKSSSCSFTKG